MIMTLEFKVWVEYKIGGKLQSGMYGPENWFLLSQAGTVFQHGPVARPSYTNDYQKIIPLFYRCRKDGEGIDGLKIFDSDVLRTFDDATYHIYWDDEYSQWWRRVINEGTRKASTRPLCEILLKGHTKVIGNSYLDPGLLKK